jgi:hypothetical protein
MCPLDATHEKCRNSKREIDKKKVFHEAQPHTSFPTKFLCFYTFHRNPKEFHRVYSFAPNGQIGNIPIGLKCSEIPMLSLFPKGGESVFLAHK